MSAAKNFCKILHLQFPCFQISVERLKNKKLAGKPFIVRNSKNNGIIAASSKEAQDYGIIMECQLLRRNFFATS